jgi:O-antigen ligase
MLRRRPRRVVPVIITVALLAGVLQWAFDLSAEAVRLLGRQPDLTSRTPVWAMLLGMATNPLIGAGYESFWSGERLVRIWSALGFDSDGIIQAHNGYIDLYLNLGLAGVGLLGAAIASGIAGTARRLEHAYAPAALCLTYILIALFYNYTEATFKPMNNVFLLLVLSILPAPRLLHRARSLAPRRGQHARSAAPASLAPGGPR